MKNLNLDKFIRKRVKDNQNLFARAELECIEKNLTTIKKIYLLALSDSKQLN